MKVTSCENKKKNDGWLKRIHFSMNLVLAFFCQRKKNTEQVVDLPRFSTTYTLDFC